MRSFTKHGSRKRAIQAPYIRGLSESIRKCLNRRKIKTFFKPINKLSSYVSLPKDPTLFTQRCGVVYQVSCTDCESVYVGQTKNSLKTRLTQHYAAFRHMHLEKSALAEHAIQCDHRIDGDNPKVLSYQNVFNKRMFVEAWMCLKHKSMNRCELFIPTQYRSLAS